MARALCRRRTGEALPRAEKFGDLITGDHKVINEEGESRKKKSPIRSRGSRSCHSLDSILSVQKKKKTSQETEKSLRKFLEPSHKPKVIYTPTIHWILANLVKIYHGIIELQHLIGLRQWPC